MRALSFIGGVTINEIFYAKWTNIHVMFVKQDFPSHVTRKFNVPASTAECEALFESLIRTKRYNQISIFFLDRNF